eukprot:Pgem_evm1s11095
MVDKTNVIKVGVGLTTLLVGEAAKSDGCDVIFSGLGSEELFAGYTRHLRVNYGLPGSNYRNELNEIEIDIKQSKIDTTALITTTTSGDNNNYNNDNDNNNSNSNDDNNNSNSNDNNNNNNNSNGEFNNNINNNNNKIAVAFSGGIDST